MTEIEEVRRDNLASLVIEYGGQKQLAQRTGLNPAQISQWLNRSINTGTGKPRVMHSTSARKIERALSLPNNWLDSPHDGTAASLNNASSALTRWKEFSPDLANCLYTLGKTAQTDRAFALILKKLQEVGLRLRAEIHDDKRQHPRFPSEPSQ